MYTVLKALASLAAAAAFVPAPATAQLSDPPAAPRFASPSPGFHGSFGRHGNRHHGRFSRDFGGGAYIAYDRDWQGDTAWRSDSFNDWWHDRPDRAFPRWMQNNQNCERKYWSGGGWRC